MSAFEFTVEPEQETAVKVSLTDEQTAAVIRILLHLRNGMTKIAFDGAAGTGKTTVVTQLAKELPTAALAAATNKACRALSQKLRKAGIRSAVETVHSSVYKPRLKAQAKPLEHWISAPAAKAPSQQEMLIFTQTFKVKVPSAEQRTEALALYQAGQRSAAWAAIGIRNFMQILDGWDRKERVGGVIIVDEASMVGEDDLESILAVYDSVILVGDSGQLPPVNAKPAFHECKTRVTLTTIHRQKADSPILDAAAKVRSGEQELYQVLQKYPGTLPTDLILSGEAVCIVYRNDTRRAVNRRIREAVGRSGGATAGDLIVIRSNDQGYALNQILRVVESNGSSLVVIDPETPAKRPEQITGWDEDDTTSVRPSGAVPYRFAFCLTCHAAQGSEWSTVFINPYDTPRIVKPNERRQWAYTAVTRARDAVYSFI